MIKSVCKLLVWRFKHKKFGLVFKTRKQAEDSYALAVNSYFMMDQDQRRYLGMVYDDEALTVTEKAPKNTTYYLSMEDIENYDLNGFDRFMLAPDIALDDIPYWFKIILFGVNNWTWSSYL